MYNTETSIRSTHKTLSKSENSEKHWPCSRQKILCRIFRWNMTMDPWNIAAFTVNSDKFSFNCLITFKEFAEEMVRMTAGKHWVSYRERWKQCKNDRYFQQTRKYMLKSFVGLLITTWEVVFPFGLNLMSLRQVNEPPKLITLGNLHIQVKGLLWVNSDRAGWLKFDSKVAVVPSMNYVVCHHKI